jgi:hypothetical protein
MGFKSISLYFIDIKNNSLNKHSCTLITFVGTQTRAVQRSGVRGDLSNIRKIVVSIKNNLN